MYAMFFWFVWKSVREKGGELIFLLLGVIFGITMEMTAMAQLKEYHYNCEMFLVNIPGIYFPTVLVPSPEHIRCLPLCIPLMESIIMYSLWSTFRLTGLNPYAQALFSGVTAMFLDLAIDPVVSTSSSASPGIQPPPFLIYKGLGFWVWLIHPDQRQLYGVLLNNFIGWLFGVTLYTILVPWIIKNIRGGWREKLIAFLIGTVMDLGILEIIMLLKMIFRGIIHEYAWMLFFLLIIGYVIQMVLMWNIKRDTRVRWDLLIVPVFFFGFTFVAAVFRGIFVEDPRFLLFWLFMLVLNIIMYTLPYKLLPDLKAALRPKI
jgi:hypothetical protein